jgi:hypothetical protein
MITAIEGAMRAVPTTANILIVVSTNRLRGEQFLNHIRTDPAVGIPPPTEIYHHEALRIIVTNATHEAALRSVRASERCEA